MGQPHLPDDDNGRVLRQMLKQGDELSEPRMIEFQHVFPALKHAVEFIAAAANKTDYLELSWFEKDNSWNVQVSRHMVPTYREITDLEKALDDKARRFGGKADGWGALLVKGKKK